MRRTTRASFPMTTLALLMMAGCGTIPGGSGGDGSAERDGDYGRVVRECSNLYVEQTREVADLFVDQAASADKICRCVAFEGSREIADASGDPGLTHRLLRAHAAQCIGYVNESDFKPGFYPDFLEWQQGQ